MRGLTKKASLQSLIEKKTSVGNLTPLARKESAKSLGIKTGTAWIKSKPPEIKDALKPTVGTPKVGPSQLSGFALLKVGAKVLDKQIDEEGDTWVKYQAVDKGPIFYAKEGSHIAGQWHKPAIYQDDGPDEEVAGEAGSCSGTVVSCRCALHAGCGSLHCNYRCRWGKTGRGARVEQRYLREGCLGSLEWIVAEHPRQHFRRTIRTPAAHYSRPGDNSGGYPQTDPGTCRPVFTPTAMGAAGCRQRCSRAGASPGLAQGPRTGPGTHSGSPTRRDHEAHSHSTRRVGGPRPVRAQRSHPRQQAKQGTMFLLFRTYLVR
jgi:hypothetical protein